MSTERVTILGCGYVGMALAQVWRSRSLHLTVTTTTESRVDALSAIADRVIVLNSSDQVALQALVNETETLIVSVASKRTQPYEMTYLGTAKNLAEVLANNTTVKQVIYTSSCGVYGDRGGDWVKESDTVNPEGENQQILAAAEQIILATATPDRKACVLRLGGIYGPDREIAKIYQRAAGTTRPGDGNNPTNWIHRDDIVAAIDLARSNRLSGIYNVVDDDWISNRELIDRVCVKYGWQPVTWDANQPSNRSYNAKVSNQKIKAAGLSLRYPKRIV